MMKKETNKFDFMKFLDVAIFVISMVIFTFCLIYAVVGYFAKFESPIKGYSYYTVIDIVKRLASLALIIIPFVLRKMGLIFPRAAIIGYNLFMLITVFGGTYMGLYVNTNWWDKFNHVMSGVLLGIAGLFFANVMTKHSDRVNSFCVFVYVFSFAVMCGAIWEIYEYVCDEFLGSNMQKFRNDHTLVEYVGREALADTMMDIIVDTIGAAATGIAAAFFTAQNREFLRVFEVSYVGKKFRKKEGAQTAQAMQEVAATKEVQAETQNAETGEKSNQ